MDDEPKFMSKVIAGASQNQEEEKSGKCEPACREGRGGAGGAFHRELPEGGARRVERDLERSVEGPEGAKVGPGLCARKEFPGDCILGGPGEKFITSPKEDH